MEIDSGPEGAPGALIGRSVVLLPPFAAQLDQVCALALAGQLTWRWGQRPRSPDAFYESFWADGHESFVVVNRLTHRILGVVRSYGMHPLEGYASVEIYLMDDPLFVPPTGGAEALWLFTDRMFSVHGLRKVYGDLTGDTFDHFQSGSAGIFAVEGRLRDHHRRPDGSSTDKVIIAVYREAWERMSSVQRSMARAASGL
jgi:hypothetical protein